MTESIRADAPGIGEDGPRQPEVPTIRIRSSHGRVPLRLREVWEYRELLYFFIWRDIKVRYKQTVIGAGWAIIQPLFTMVIFSLFFGLLAGIPSEGLPYPLFYYCALLPWMYFAGALNNATNSIVENQRVITKVYFPRLILPLSAVLSGLLDFAIACLMLVGIMGYYGIRPAPTAWLLPLFILLAMATAFGAGLWSSALNAVYRDVRYAMPFLIQAWMFVSPVAYPSSLVPEGWRWLYGLNPMAGVIEGFRWALTGRGRAPDLLLFASSGTVCLLVAGGLFYFRRAERTIADVV